MKNVISNGHCDINNESGNVFVIILISIILFGLLVYTFTKSANKGTGNITRQQEKVIVQDIINTANNVRRGIDRVRSKGCSEADISFYTPELASYISTSWVNIYNHSNAPPDNSCHIFHPEGGKVIYPNLRNPEKILTSTADGDMEVFHFISRGQFRGIGEPLKSELSLYIGSVTENICKAFNREMLGDETIYPGIFAGRNDIFRGTYFDDFSDSAATNNVALSGESAFCLDNASPPGTKYHIYIVVFER